MSRARTHLSLVVDQVIAEANSVAHRRDHETHAIKTAEAQPKTELAHNLRALAADVRSHEDRVSYADLMGAP